MACYAGPVQPYRSEGSTIERYELGSERSFLLRVGGGVGLVLGAPAAYLLLLLVAGVFFPHLLVLAGVGVLLLRSARRVVLEVARSEGVVRVTVTRVGPKVHVQIPFEELEGVRIACSDPGTKNPDYELALVRAGQAPVLLLRARSEASLEPSREGVGAFLLDQGALGKPRARLAVSNSADPATPSKPTIDEPPDTGQDDASSRASHE